MPHTDTSKSQATNRTSYHASHRYLQITSSKSCFLPCLTQIPANHRQQIVNLAMPHTDTSKSQTTNRTSYHASHRHQQITGSKSCFLPASHRYQQITGNKSYILPCLTQIPANHRQQVVLLTMLQVRTKSSILPCLTQIPANPRQQIVHLTMPHTHTSKSQATKRTSYHASHRYQQITGNLANKSYISPCLTLIPANHCRQVVLLALPHTDASKSQTTNRTSYHASHRHQQITGNKSYNLPCLTQIPASHRQQIVHLTMPHTNTCKSQATNRTSYHASHRHQPITGNKSCILPCLTQIPANHRQQIVHLTMPHTDTRKSQAILPTNRTSCHASR